MSQIFTLLSSFLKHKPTSWVDIQDQTLWAWQPHENLNYLDVALLKVKSWSSGADGGKDGFHWTSATPVIFTHFSQLFSSQSHRMDSLSNISLCYCYYYCVCDECCQRVEFVSAHISILAGFFTSSFKRTESWSRRFQIYFSSLALCTNMSVITFIFLWTSERRRLSFTLSMLTDFSVQTESVDDGNFPSVLRIAFRKTRITNRLHLWDKLLDWDTLTKS